VKKDHDEKKKKSTTPEAPMPEYTRTPSATRGTGSEEVPDRIKDESSTSLSTLGEQKDIETGEREKEEPGSTEIKGQEDVEQSLEQVEKEKQDLYDRYIRLMADFDNLKKRSAKERAEVIQFGNESLLRDFLPVVDNIERLLTYSLQKGDWEALGKGIELVLQEIQKLFVQYDVRPIEAIGKPFSPNIHEAIQKVANREAAPDVVVDEYQKGYTFRGRLLRPSLVAVTVAPPGEEDKEKMRVGLEEVEGEEESKGKPIIN
jgi:molecular chaperone GrpE